MDPAGRSLQGKDLAAGVNNCVCPPERCGLTLWREHGDLHFTCAQDVVTSVSVKQKARESGVRVSFAVASKVLGSAAGILHVHLLPAVEVDDGGLVVVVVGVGDPDGDFGAVHEDGRVGVLVVADVVGQKGG